MKTSAVLASALLSAFAVAAPVDKRGLVYQTEIVTETVVIYTTVYDDNYVPEATPTSEGLFYEQPATSSSVVVVPTSSAAPAPAPQVQEASSAPAPVPETPTPSPTPVVTPTPAPVVETPKEAAQPTTSAAVAAAAAPAAASPAPVASQPSTGGTATGESFSSVDMTVYDTYGAFGACGTQLHDTDFIVALSKDAWGSSTYDVMTGAATNPWCGQKIQIQYGGNTVDATIMDMCPGCKGHDIDLSWATWKAVTGVSTPERYQASWSKIA